MTVGDLRSFLHSFTVKNLDKLSKKKEFTKSVDGYTLAKAKINEMNIDKDLKNLIKTGGKK